MELSAELKWEDLEESLRQTTQILIILQYTTDREVVISTTRYHVID